MADFVYRSEDTKELLAALDKFDEFTIVLEPDKTDNRGHKYVSKGLILKNTKKELKKCGLRFIRTTETINGNEYIVTELNHIKSGQFIRSTHFYYSPAPLDNTGIRGLGGLRTYITRYEIMDMLYLDDGAPDPDEPITLDQVKELELLAKSDPEVISVLCKYFQVPELRNIPYYQFAAATKQLKVFLKQLGQ